MMCVYELKSVGYLDSTAVYDLLLNGRRIMENVPYVDGYNYVLANGRSDDLYSEYDKDKSEPYYTGRVREVKFYALKRQQSLWEIDHKV